MTADEIFTAVEAVTGVDRANIRSPRRMPHVCRARCLAALLLADEGHLTRNRIAEAVNRSPWAVTRELARAEKLLADPDFNAMHTAALARLRQREAA